LSRIRRNGREEDREEEGSVGDTDEGRREGQRDDDHEEAPKAAATKAAKPKAAATKAAAPKAAKPKAAPIKLTESQADLLKKVHGAGETGYTAAKPVEDRSLAALVEKKMIKKGAKDKATGKVPHTVSTAGKKHVEKTSGGSTPTT
jgi:hypothetical protein